MRVARVVRVQGADEHGVAADGPEARELPDGPELLAPRLGIAEGVVVAEEPVLGGLALRGDAPADDVPLGVPEAPRVLERIPLEGAIPPEALDGQAQERLFYVAEFHGGLERVDAELGQPEHVR